MKVAGKMGIGASSDSSELTEKIKKIEERVYLHDAKFADQQLIIDSTSVNLQMHQMIPHEASNSQEASPNAEKFQEELVHVKEKLAEVESLIKNKPKEGEEQMKKLETKIDETQKELKMYPLNDR